MATLSVEVGEETPVGRIKRVMTVRNITLQSLSEMSGIAYRTLQSNLSGTHALKLETLAKICKNLSISSDFILFGDEFELDEKYIADAIDTIDQFEKLGVDLSSVEKRAELFNYGYGFALRSELYNLSAREMRDLIQKLMAERTE